MVMWVSAQDLKGLGYKKGKPLGLVGVTELSDDQKKQIKEQQEVRKCQLCLLHVNRTGKFNSTQ